MKENVKYAIKATLFYVMIPFLVGAGLGQFIKYQQKKQETKEIAAVVEGYSTQFTDLTYELECRQEADSSASRDQLINEYLLRTFSLYEQTYRCVVENKLLEKKNQKTFNQAMDLLHDIYRWQLEKEKYRESFLSGMGLSQMYVIEAEQMKRLTDAYTVLTCDEVLEIDPGNQDARRVILDITKDN